MVRRSDRWTSNTCLINRVVQCCRMLFVMGRIDLRQDVRQSNRGTLSQERGTHTTQDPAINKSRTEIINKDSHEFTRTLPFLIVP